MPLLIREEVELTALLANEEWMLIHSSECGIIFSEDAILAQLVERRYRKPQVPGSIPGDGSKIRCFYTSVHSSNIFPLFLQSPKYAQE